MTAQPPACQLTLNEALQMSVRRLIDYIHYLGFELPTPPQNGKWGKGQVVQMAMQFAQQAAANGCVLVNVAPTSGTAIPKPTTGAIASPGGGFAPAAGSGAGAALLPPHVPAIVGGFTGPTQAQAAGRGAAVPGAGRGVPAATPVAGRGAAPPQVGIAPQAAAPAVVQQQQQPVVVKWVAPIPKLAAPFDGATFPWPLVNGASGPDEECKRISNAYHEALVKSSSIIGAGIPGAGLPAGQPAVGTPWRYVNIPYLRLPSTQAPPPPMEEPEPITGVGYRKPTYGMYQGDSKIMDYSKPLGTKWAKTVAACVYIQPTAQSRVYVKDGEFVEIWREDTGILVHACVAPPPAGLEECTTRLMYIQFIYNTHNIYLAQTMMNIYYNAMKESIGFTGPGASMSRQFFMAPEISAMCDSENFSSYGSSIAKALYSGNYVVLRNLVSAESFTFDKNIHGNVYSMAEFLKLQLPRLMDYDTPKNSIWNQIKNVIGMIVTELAFVRRDLTDTAMGHLHQQQGQGPFAGKYEPLYYYHPTIGAKDFAVVQYDDARIGIYLLPRPYKIDGVKLTNEPVRWYAELSEKMTFAITQNVSLDDCNKWLTQTMARVEAQMSRML